MVMCEYFSASGDDVAVRVLDEPGGPDNSSFDVVSLKGIDPVVALVQLEAVLTSCTYDEAAARPRSGRLLSSPEAENALVIGVSDTLQEALASARHASLAEAAASWADTDELRQSGITADTAHGLLLLLSGLAGRARSAGQRLFCWWAL